MIYVYRQRNSTGARDLTEGILLQGTSARRTKGQALRTLTPQDAVVCWGDHFAVPAGRTVRTLNNVAPVSKFTEAQTLREKGVATVQVSRTRPAAAVARPAVPAVRPLFSLGGFGQNLDEAAIRLLIQRAQAHLNAPLPPAQPAVPAEIWLPRRNNHIGGADLLDAPAQPDYYSKKEDIVEEYRLHMFRGKSIRAGKKTQEQFRPDGRTPSHPWIRSFDAGWKIRYDGFSSTKAQRELAAAALKALGLDFGAVDMGKLANGNLIVLEVNRAPGVEGGTVESYARHIIHWYTGAAGAEERE